MYNSIFHFTRVSNKYAAAKSFAIPWPCGESIDLSGQHVNDRCHNLETFPKKNLICWPTYDNSDNWKKRFHFPFCHSEH